MVGVARVRLDGCDDGGGRNKAGNVVDMAVSIVADDAAIEPDGVVDAEIVVKDALELLAADAGVALLHVAQLTFFGGE